MPSETPGYGLLTDTVQGTRVEPADWDKLTNTVDKVSLALAEFFNSSGMVTESDFIGTVIPGSLAIQVSGKYAVIGARGERVVVSQEGSVILNNADENNILDGTFTPSTTNYLYLKKDGTYLVNTTGVFPSEDYALCLTGVASGTQFTSINNSPTSRRNLTPIPTDGKVYVNGSSPTRKFLADSIEAGTGITTSIVGDKLRITNSSTGSETPVITPTTKILPSYVVHVSPDTDILLEWNFSLVGSFNNNGYNVALAVSPSPPNVLVFEQKGNKTGTKFWVYVQNTGGSGGYEAAVTITPTLNGFGWTNAGGTSANPIEHEISVTSPGGTSGETLIGSWLMIAETVASPTRLENATTAYAFANQKFCVPACTITRMVVINDTLLRPEHNGKLSVHLTKNWSENILSLHQTELKYNEPQEVTGAVNIEHLDYLECWTVYTEESEMASILCNMSVQVYGIRN